MCKSHPEGSTIWLATASF